MSKKKVSPRAPFVVTVAMAGSSLLALVPACNSDIITNPPPPAACPESAPKVGDPCTDETGCSGAWYRTAFVDSVLRYYRRRDKQGNRIDNPLLSRCDDELVLESIRALESYEDIANAEAESAAIRRAQKG